MTGPGHGEEGRKSLKLSEGSLERTPNYFLMVPGEGEESGFLGQAPNGMGLRVALCGFEMGRETQWRRKRKPVFPRPALWRPGDPGFSHPEALRGGECSAYASRRSAGFQERGEGRSKQVNASWAGEPGEPLDPRRPEAP